MSSLWLFLAFLISIYSFIFLARAIISLLLMIRRSRVVSKPAAVVFEIIYSLTDPPLRFLQKFIKPLRIGGIMLDISFLVAIIVLSLLQGLFLVLAHQAFRAFALFVLNFPNLAYLLVYLLLPCTHTALHAKPPLLCSCPIVAKLCGSGLSN